MTTDRNRDPHAAARVAMCLYCDRYCGQDGGAMDFFDNLSDGEKQTCARIADDIRAARPYTGQHAPSRRSGHKPARAKR